MTVPRFTFLLLVLLLPVSGAFAATLESAQEHYDSGDLDAARSELRDLLDSSADDDVRADALNLLGTIAVDRQEWTQAHEAWSTLLAEYPGSAAAGEARTKLTLVTALMDAQGEKPSAPPPAPAPAVIPTPTVTPTPEQAPPVTSTPPAAVAPPEPTVQSTPAAPAAPVAPAAPAPPAATVPESADLVLVAGRGRPYNAVEESTRRLIAWLVDQGVNAESATTGIAVVQDSDLVLPQLLQAARDRGAHSVLYLEARYNTTPESVKYFLYQPDGTELWKTKIRGGTGWTGEPYSKSGMKEKLFLRSLEKLLDKVGGPGLPVG